MTTFRNNFVTNSKENPAIDTTWVILCTFIVFTMQTGFGLLESGLIRSKNEANVLVRNTMDLVVGGTAYWFFGFGFSYGTKANAFCGANNFFLHGIVEDRPVTFLKFFFQFAFAATATTIVSGAVTERIKLKAYIIFAFINTGFTYPIIAHWMWAKEGWLKKLGAYDFAGGSVVHITGGAGALVGSLILGARNGRFDKSREDEFRPSKPMNVLVGTFLLWFGWIGFNCGSTFGVTAGAWEVAAAAAMVTTLGACGGGMGIILLSFILERRRKYFLDIGELGSGVLAGLVAVTPIASQSRPEEGFLIGLTGSLVAIGAMYLLQYLKVDDPVGCFGIHWAAGTWGMIMVGFFAEKDPIVGLAPSNGLFRGGTTYLLQINFLAVICITCFSGTMTMIIFMVMRFTIGIRLSEEEEEDGSDFVEHAVKAPKIMSYTKMSTEDLHSDHSDDVDDARDSF